MDHPPRSAKKERKLRKLSLFWVASITLMVVALAADSILLWVNLEIHHAINLIAVFPLVVSMAFLATTLYLFYVREGITWVLLGLKRLLNTTLDRHPGLFPKLRKSSRFNRWLQSNQPFLLGFRYFRVLYESPYLLPTTNVFSAPHWRPGPNGALCVVAPFHAPADVPAEGCYCGFWMRNNIWSIRWMRRRGTASQRGIIAAVVGWGKVIPHSGSWRCQQAMVIALLQESHVPVERMRQIARYYDVPVFQSGRELKRYAKHYLRTNVSIL